MLCTTALHYVHGVSDRPVSDHLIWKIRGLTRFMSSGDEMHALALGPLLDLHGSAIADLIDPEIGCVTIGTTPHRRVEDVFLGLLECYRSCKTQ